MDALEIINENIDPLAIMRHYDFDRIFESGGMIRSCCKLHGGSESSAFVMNERTGLWYCHTGDCGGGNIYGLVQVLEKCGFNQAVLKVAEILGIDIENMEIIKQKDESVVELNQWVRTMSSWIRKEKFSQYEVDEEVKDVVKFRGFKEDTLKHFGLKFVESMELNKRDGGTYTLRNRLLVPIVQGAVQVGVSLRKTKSSDYPKWSHQPSNIKTRELLYNYDETSGAERIAVVEGPFDVWAFHEIGVIAVATYGAHLTEQQCRLLIKTGADLVFANDGDKAGVEATSKAVDMLRYKANMEFIMFDEGEDPASIDREKLKIKYKGREKLWNTQFRT